MSKRSNRAASPDPTAATPTRRALAGLAFAMVLADLLAIAGLLVGVDDAGVGTVLVAAGRALAPALHTALALTVLAWAPPARSSPALVGAAFVLIAFASGLLPLAAWPDGSEALVGDVRFLTGVVGLAVIGVAAARGRPARALLSVLLVVASTALARSGLTTETALFVAALLVVHLVLAAILALPSRARGGAAPILPQPDDDVALRAAARGTRLIRLGFAGFAPILLVPLLLVALEVPPGFGVGFILFGVLVMSVALVLIGLIPLRRLPAAPGIRVLAWATTTLLIGVASTFAIVLVGKIVDLATRTSHASLTSPLPQLGAAVFTYLAHVTTAWLGRGGLRAHVRAVVAAPIVFLVVAALPPLLRDSVVFSPFGLAAIDAVAALPYLIAALAAGRLARDLDAAALVTPFGDAPAQPAPSTLEPTPS